ncbi:MAG: pantetheine-phosphate adenylyltransferase [Candidatus Ranarchaeia archaeon]
MTSNTDINSYQYDSLIFSGTFDRLHSGHIYILRRSFSLSKFVLIGITSNKMIESKKLFHLIQPVEVRKRELETFLIKSGWKGRFEIKIIETPFGFATAIKEIDAILVSEEPSPFKWAKRINHIREAKGWKSLEIITIPYVKNLQKKRISSLAIRQGKINREGKIIPFNTMRKKIFQLKRKHLVLPFDLRKNLKDPFGELVKSSSYKKTTKKALEIISNKDSEIIAIGDIVSKYLSEHSDRVKVYVIDLKTQRENIPKFIPESDHSFQVRNPPGEITIEAWNSLQIAFDSLGSTSIIVQGEEDLLVLPSVLLAPLGSYVLYGQPNEGIVLVEVTKEIRKKIINILDQFIRVD